MPEITRSYCDECSTEMNESNRFLIYRIDFWNKADYDKEKRDYLMENDCALMLCSQECIGKYIRKLIERTRD